MPEYLSGIFFYRRSAKLLKETASLDFYSKTRYSVLECYDSLHQKGAYIKEYVHENMF